MESKVIKSVSVFRYTTSLVKRGKFYQVIVNKGDQVIGKSDFYNRIEEVIPVFELLLDDTVEKYN